MRDYNARFHQTFTIPTYGKMKKDIQLRLAHKRPYERIERMPEEQLDLLIVVDQMLTGFDSKWLNVLYLDKVLRYESIIQAFSRTNRLFGPEKPFGSIKYYRAPYTMEQNIHAAVKLYSGDKPLGMFAVADKNLGEHECSFCEIKNLLSRPASSILKGFRLKHQKRRSLRRCSRTSMRILKPQKFRLRRR